MGKGVNGDRDRDWLIIWSTFIESIEVEGTKRGIEFWCSKIMFNGSGKLKLFILK
ncbi:12233_t:CDS:2 [Gigaspora margarita]|uniref:12233_t:CDS:1 n=1 Tax=Gigaspora margarita TaxID=4874 RepID=A0ABM8W7F0_GIGMA|nr:12233_t:CDS:2 [Gigaspora margarita]